MEEWQTAVTPVILIAIIFVVNLMFRE